MIARKILPATNPRLRKKAAKVSNFGPDIQKLADEMLAAMRKANGVGLAGPQIGVMKRIFVAEIPYDEDDPQSGRPFVLINPRFLFKTEELVEGEEGCLSIPGWYGLVNRARTVQVEAENVQGKTIQVSASDFLARVFQHESDHLDGILFTDYIDTLDKIWQLSESGERTPATEWPPVLEPQT